MDKVHKIFIFLRSEVRSARWCQLRPKINISILYCTLPVEINPETGGKIWEQAEGGPNFLATASEALHSLFEPSTGSRTNIRILRMINEVLSSIPTVKTV
jgi:hypothetical protein